MTERRFSYRAVEASGKTISAMVTARDRADALRLIKLENQTVLSLSEKAESGGPGWRPFANGVGSEERIQVLRQLSVMVRAGVELLETLDTIAGALHGRQIAEHIRKAAAQLRQGRRLAKAFETAVPGYPAFVYALMRAGEASGRLALTLEEAVRQMSYEERTKRDLQNALIYPAFLVFGGVASIGFLFYAVVPRFAEMLRNANAELHGLSAFVIGAGEVFHDHAALIVALIGALLAMLISAATTSFGKRMLSVLAHNTPGLRRVLMARRRAGWSRIMAIALRAGVGVLEAAALAGGSLPDGRLRAAALGSIQTLRNGRPVDETFVKAHLLSAIDGSLIRAGQRSGALAEMFAAVADRNEEDLRDTLKRLTALVEPLAVAIVAVAIGAIVLGLVSALVSIYDSIG